MTSHVADMVALIPARAGSKRIPGKNLKLLGGHPLLAYAIASACQSRCFRDVYVSTDDEDAAAIALWYGAVTIRRPADYATDTAPDILWVRHALQQMPRPYAFAILRPTSPFRTAATIQRAWRTFYTPDGTHDSIRAVEPVTQHPGKMWTWDGAGEPIRPLLPGKTRSDGTPWHSSPTQTLPVMYVQNACLEMGFTSNVETHGSISGRKVYPFFTTGYEGVDLNTPDDWRRAEALCAAGAVELPALPVAHLPTTASGQ